MKRYEVMVHPGGRITVPATIRRNHDLQPGDVVIWFEQDDHLCFRKARPDELAADDNRVDADRTPAFRHGQKIDG